MATVVSLFKLTPDATAHPTLQAMLTASEAKILTPAQIQAGGVVALNHGEFLADMGLIGMGRQLEAEKDILKNPAKYIENFHARQAVDLAKLAEEATELYLLLAQKGIGPVQGKEIVSKYVETRKTYWDTLLGLDYPVDQIKKAQEDIRARSVAPT